MGTHKLDLLEQLPRFWAPMGMDPCVCLEEIGLLYDAQNMMLNHSRLNTQHNCADLYFAHLMSPTIFTLTNP